MLKLRILSALILVPLVVWGVLKLDQTGFSLMVAFVVALAAWEWGPLVPIKGAASRVAYLVLTLGLIAVTWTLARQEVLVNGLLWLALAVWLVALFWITRPDLGREATPQHSAAKAALGVLLLLATWLSLVVLHSRPDQGPHWVLYLMVLVWVADSGAYFAGRQWGRNKLAPQVSPGKTWEGVFGALVACSVFSWSYAQFIELKGAAQASFMMICIVTVLFSIAGDLLESLLKRHRGIKDSGKMIPGHGGILDRIDSMLAAAPVFVAGLRWVQL